MTEEEKSSLFKQGVLIDNTQASGDATMNFDFGMFDTDDSINDVNKLLWLGKQDLPVIMEVLALPSYLEKPNFGEDITKPMKFDFYF